MPPPDYRQNQQAYSQYMYGLNSMQTQAGLLPGGIPMAAPPPIPPPRSASPAEISTNLRVQFQQQQQLAQTVMPPPLGLGGITPVNRATDFQTSLMVPPLNLPSPQFGSGRMMARQIAIGNTNQHLAMLQAGTGAGARLAGDVGMFGAGAMAGGLVGMPMLGGTLAATAGEHFGLGQGIQRFATNMFNPLIEQRQRALSLQNQSMGFVRGGMDLSNSGTGLSMGAATRLSQGLGRMADNASFQRDTQGMFNRQDVMKITRLSGELGMLDQSQTADQIKDSVGRISRALTNFMKIAEEPDVKEALRMMGQMRALGMSVPETSQAAQNARMFARMAGTDVRSVMAQGMAGAGMYQQMGLSGASGLNAGMASAGMSAQLASIMNPRMLAMAGGREGIANTMMQGGARAGVLDALLPAMLTRRNGQLAIDEEAIMDMASGRTDIQGAMRQGSSRIRQLGGRSALMELSTRRRELQDEAQNAMGGQMATLLPLIQARMIAQSTPGMTMGGALRTLGMGEQQARTYEMMVSDPRFFENIRHQRQIEQREQQRDVARQRDEVRRYAHTPEVVRNTLTSMSGPARGIRNTIDRFMEDNFGDAQDTIEEQEAAGGGELIRFARRDRLGSDIQRAQLRDSLGTQEGAAQQLSRAWHMHNAATGQIQNEEVRSFWMDQTRAFSPVGGALLNRFHGPNGFGLSEAGRGGQFMRQTISGGDSIGQRFGEAIGVSQLFGLARRPEEVAARAQELQTLGNMFSQDTDIASRESRRNFNAARAAFGRTSSGRSQNANVQYENTIGRAAAAVNEYLDDQTVLGEGVGGIGDRNALKAHLAERLSASGMSRTDVDALINNDSFLQEAINAGADSRTADQQAAADRIVEVGSGVDENSRVRRIQHTREQANQSRERALGAIGVGSGFLDRASDDERRRILNVIGGTGERANVRRQIFAMQMLSKAGKGEQAARIRARLQQSGLSEEEIRGLQAEVSGQTSGISEGVARNVAESFGNKGADDIISQLNRAGESVNTANTQYLEGGLNELLGEGGRQAFGSGGAEGLRNLREFVRGNGRTGLSREQRNRLLSGDLTEQELAQIASRRGGGGDEMSFAGGLNTFAHQAANADFGGMLDTLQNFATHGGEAPQAGPRTPMTFEEAIGTFSEASDKLLEAANKFSGSSSIFGIGNILANGSPLVPGLSALPGPTGILGQIANVFGGDD